MTDAYSLSARRPGSGGSPDNDIVLTGDLDVSRYHAELRRNPDGSFEIIDLGSHGGTFVNGERIIHTMLTEQDVSASAAPRSGSAEASCARTPAKPPRRPPPARTR